jgi:hypothetical protein
MKYVLALILIPNLAFGFSEIPKNPPYNYGIVKDVSFDGKPTPVGEFDYSIDFGTAYLLFCTA